MNKSGKIEVIFGPMFSGKSTELLRRIRRYQYLQKHILVINYGLDNRYSNEQCLSTHDNIQHKAIKTHQLPKELKFYEEYDIIAIDEGQFFDDIAEVADFLANHNKHVIVAALDSTYQRKPFNNILQLIPICESIDKLDAICSKCKQNNASFTKRIVKNDQVELIGGSDLYEANCRKCYLNESRDSI